MTPTTIPPLLAALCDDAAVFPPGLAPLPRAVEVYRDRAATWVGDLVGPLVLGGQTLPALASLLSESEPPLPVSLTFPDGPAGVPAALDAAAELPVEVRALEVAVPVGVSPGELLDRLGAAVSGLSGPDVYVEIPRDERRLPVIEAIAGRYRAKLRTGGEHVDLYPGEAELAATLAAVVAAGLPFKLTAGLHHPLRNTDPGTGFEQHGFLNLLLATDLLAQGGPAHEAAALLAERDGQAVARLLGEFDEPRVRQVRSWFVSFGTCSITDPLSDLIALGLVRPSEDPFS